MDLPLTDPPAASTATPQHAEPHPGVDDAALSKNTKRLAIDPTKRASLPSSSPHASTGQKRLSSSPNTQKPPSSPMARSPSVMSNRPASPALSRRSSVVSAQGDSRITPRKDPSRRTSSSIMGSSPGFMSKSPLANQTPLEEAPPLTAAKVAADYFTKELATHDNAVTSPRTIVILHDACYGHRFSRPKTTKSALSMIVERPERIHAGVLGISTAYVRFGDRHSGAENGPHPHREPDTDIPFKIRRTSRAVDITSSIVTNVHGTQWMNELRTMCDSAGVRLSTNGKELARTQDPSQPNQPAKDAFHEGDLYLCSESLNAFQGALGGVCDGVDAVFGSNGSPKQAFVCVRPPGHHCSADFPSGFCWLNNVHVGIEYAAMNHGLTHAAILDFDLHHGDGSQDITWQRNSKVAKLPKNAHHSKKTAIGYFSLHDINSYPCEYGEIHKVQNASICIENAHNQTIWNVHLQPWKTEADFWDLYETKYITLIEKARNFLRMHTQRLRASPTLPQPKAAIFLSAGFDASEWESAGMQRHKVNVPTEFYARFTRDVVRMAQEEDLGVDGRIVSVLEGGYSDRALTSGVLSHLSGLCDGDTVKSTRPRQGQDPADDMAEQMEGLELNGATASDKTLRYNVEWWHHSNLTALETMVYPAPPPPPKKAPRTGPAPNFATPTQSFTAKVVDPTKIRSTSGVGPERNYTYVRPPTPPAPEVDWVTAAHELCKLLVPTDRQTKSFRPDELTEPRVKKEKMPPPPPVPSGRQLRDRKSKVTNYSEPPSDDETISVRSASRSSRRQTIDAPAGPAQDAPTQLPMRTTRRQSFTSDVGSTAGDRPSSRASSVAPRGSGKTSNAGVQVKKTRAPNNTRLQPKAQPSVKEAPAPKPSRSKPAATVDHQQVTDADHMDDLTSGLKRITLKMPSKEEHDARREREAQAEAEATSAPATKPGAKKAATARPPKAQNTKIPAAAEKPAQTSIQAQRIPRPVPPPLQMAEMAASAALPPGLKTPAGDVPLALSQSDIDILQPQPLPDAVMLDAAGGIVDTGGPGLSTTSSIIGSAAIADAGPVRLPVNSPPRPDTPPPPPPASMPHFLEYAGPGPGAGAAGVGEGEAAPDAQAGAAHTIIQWVEQSARVEVAGPPPATATATMGMAPMVRAELPRFSADGYIPFAALPGGSAQHVVLPTGSAESGGGVAEGAAEGQGE